MEKKLNELFKEVATSEEPVQSQWWYGNEAEIERSPILATSRKQFDNSPITNCIIQMSKDYADFVNGSGRKSFHSTPPSKMEMPIHLSVVPFINEQKGFNRRGDRPRMKSDYLKSPYIIQLFLPVVRSFHIFLFVINLQHPEFVIIDNSKVDDIDVKYGQLSHIIKTYILDYLRSQNHPKTEMSHLMPHRLEMPWRTINNHIDCGVFTRRHMETYMGGSMNEFKVGFKNKSLAKDDQLAKLRTKYLYKIITQEYNVHKDVVLQKVDQFHKIPSRQRSEMLSIAKEQIHTILDDFS
ncbi:unnamed protein product [Lactuca virosa]|uniref:Ubiquitin-like protease family profile domain-containing protein n=1 Tax=Lactuca virosa TaxID=75947 RepID=A0AAU9MP36_9ASTR|nr:unnamed protein product [Lactuca virosa]